MINHIRYLLYRHNCVIVPDFGGFILQNQPVRRTTKKIFPFQKTVRFNKKLKINDGLLCHQIAVSENLTHEHALLKIQTIVNKWNTVLKEKKNLHLHGIGHFENTRESTWVFYSNKDVNFSTESFGLAPIQSIPLSIYKRERKWNYAAAAVFFLAAIAYGWYNRSYWEPLQRESLDALSSIIPFSFDQESKREPVENSNSSTKIPIKQQEDIEKAGAKSSKADEKTFLEKEPFVSLSKNYYVIAGVFQSEKRAKKLTERLKKDHLLAEVFKAKERFFVSYGTYPNYEKAQEELNKISPLTPDDQPWIKTSE